MLITEFATINCILIASIMAHRRAGGEERRCGCPEVLRDVCGTEDKGGFLTITKTKTESTVRKTDEANRSGKMLVQGHTDNTEKASLTVT